MIWLFSHKLLRITTTTWNSVTLFHAAWIPRHPLPCTCTCTVICGTDRARAPCRRGRATTPTAVDSPDTRQFRLPIPHCVPDSTFRQPIHRFNVSRTPRSACLPPAIVNYALCGAPTKHPPAPHKDKPRPVGSPAGGDGRPPGELAIFYVLGF